MDPLESAQPNNDFAATMAGLPTQADLNKVGVQETKPLPVTHGDLEGLPKSTELSRPPENVTKMPSPNIIITPPEVITTVTKNKKNDSYGAGTVFAFIIIAIILGILVGGGSAYFLTSNDPSADTLKADVVVTEDVDTNTFPASYAEDEFTSE